MDRYWTRSSIRSSIPSGKKTKHSSSAWTITSGRRCGYRILEAERWPSEQIWALSTLVWRNVEEYTGKKAEATRRGFRKLTRQDKKFFTSELFKVIQDAITLILHCRTLCWFRTISSSTFIISDVQSVYTPSQIQIWYREGKIQVEKRQTVFFTAVYHMNKDHRDPQELDLTKPRLASCKQKWKVHQDTVYWIDIQLAQRKGLKFYQTRTNAIILYDTIPAYCISKVVVMKSEEIIYQKVYVSPRPPPKISYTNNRMNELDSEVAGSSKDTQRIQPKPKTQLSRTPNVQNKNFSGNAEELAKVLGAE